MNTYRKLSPTDLIVLVSLCTYASRALFPLLGEGGAVAENAWIEGGGASSVFALVDSLFLYGLLSYSLLNAHRLKSESLRLPPVFFVFFCFAFFSCIYSDYSIASIKAVFRPAVVAVSVCLLVKKGGTDQFLKKVYSLMLIYVILSVAFALLLPSYGIAAGNHEGAWQGIFTHKNLLGNVAWLSSMLSLYFLSQTVKFFHFAYFLLSACVLFLSGSYTSLACLMLGIFIIFIYRFLQVVNFTWKRAHSLLGFLLAFVISAVLVWQSIAGYQYALADKDASFSGRNAIWAYVLQAIMDNPWFGYGADAFWIASNKNPSLFISSVGFLQGSAHNGFLDLVLSFGFIGAFLFLLLLGNVIYRLPAKTKSDLIMIISAISVVIINTFESRLFGLNVNWLLISLIGCLANRPFLPLQFRK